MNAEFLLDREQLVFNIRENLGEEDIMTVFSKSDRNVVEKLSSYINVNELFADLPKELEK